jgi:type IV secretory pathway VirB10-like protein
MKKIIIAIAILLGTVGFVHAQTTTTATKTTKKEKKAKTTAATPATTVKAKGTKKDGTPDMRLKANKVKATAPTTAPAPVAIAKPVKAPKTKAIPPAAPTMAKPTAQAAPAASVKTADKVIGTDAKGRTIYQGPRGGKYYVDKSGNKEYVK